MSEDLGALSGSREPKPLAGSALSGFDPEREMRWASMLEKDRENLAVLLWDFFGPKLPKLSEARIRNSRPATPREITNYRTAAAFILSSMYAARKGDYPCGCAQCFQAFRGNHRYAMVCPTCIAQAIEAGTAKTEGLGPKDESAVTK